MYSSKRTKPIPNLRPLFYLRDRQVLAIVESDASGHFELVDSFDPKIFIIDRIIRNNDPNVGIDFFDAFNQITKAGIAVECFHADRDRVGDGATFWIHQKRLFWVFDVEWDLGLVGTVADGDDVS